MKSLRVHQSGIGTPSTAAPSTHSRMNIRAAKQLWGDLPQMLLLALRAIGETYQLSVAMGEILYLERRWYVTHSGLLGLAYRKHCSGIDVCPVLSFCDPGASRWAFKATVFKSPKCKGFVGYGDADPSNVSPLVRGAEMRVAETRAVNRALRKAYGIGICSVEELGSGLDAATGRTKIPPQPANGKGFRSHPKLRDRLLQLIRQHQLDPVLVKDYAVDFCGGKTLREASREQVENFIQHLADWAEKDKNALLCQLNSYLRPESSTDRGAA
jgi:hypothetical protein